VLHPH